jgi:peptidyl-prolyl cis-trans isomerase B (cyclophilin B)
VIRAGVSSTIVGGMPRMGPLAATLTSVLLLVAAGCSSTSGPGASSGVPAGRYSAAPPMTIDRAKTYGATITTAKGVIELSLDPKAAPVTVNNFVFLAREKFYDGVKFHRVEAGFVVQGGDPKGDGTGGPGYAIPDESSPLDHVAGALGMAKGADPDSAGSQFYITLTAQPSLDRRYTVFGKVTAGMDVVAKITRGDVITSVTVSER